jgi:hypothetical protein
LAPKNIPTIVPIPIPFLEEDFLAFL